MAVLLVLVILIQEGRGDELGGTFGGGGADSIFSATGGRDFLVKFTAWLSVFFIIFLLAIAKLSTQVTETKSELKKTVEQTQTTAPVDTTKTTPDTQTDTTKDTTKKDGTK